MTRAQKEQLVSVSEYQQGISTVPGGSTSKMAHSRVVQVDAGCGPGMQVGLSSGTRSWDRHLSSLHGPLPAAAWAPSQHSGWSPRARKWKSPVPLKVELRSGTTSLCHILVQSQAGPDARR